MEKNIYRLTVILEGELKDRFLNFTNSRLMSKGKFVRYAIEKLLNDLEKETKPVVEKNSVKSVKKEESIDEILLTKTNDYEKDTKELTEKEILERYLP